MVNEVFIPQQISYLFPLFYWHMVFIRLEIVTQGGIKATIDFLIIHKDAINGVHSIDLLCILHFLFRLPSLIYRNYIFRHAILTILVYSRTRMVIEKYDRQCLSLLDFVQLGPSVIYWQTTNSFSESSMSGLQTLQSFLKQTHTAILLSLSSKRRQRASQSTRLMFTSTALPMNFFCSACVPMSV